MNLFLGKWEQDAGYIGEAKNNGGIYFDTGKATWDAVKHGLGSKDAEALGWQVNEQFLRTQMENGVSRIEFMLGDYPSLEDALKLRKDSFSAKEIRYLIEHAPEYGYRRVGNVWVKD